jgi:hypothetical protein
MVARTPKWDYFEGDEDGGQNIQSYFFDLLAAPVSEIMYGSLYVCNI